MIRAFTNWQPFILNYFEHPVTNAYTESLNSLIRVMNRLGRGYSFEALRAKILFTEGVHAMGKRPKFQRREAPPMYGVPPDGFMAKMVMSPVASYPHEGNEAERNFGAHIPTLIELIESGGL